MTILNHDQSRSVWPAWPGYLTYLTSPVTLPSAGELSRTPTQPRPALTLGLGPVRLQPVSSGRTRLGPGLHSQLKSSPRHIWRPIMKSFEYLHKLFVHKNNPCYQTCWLCNDFRIASGNLRSHPILIVNPVKSSWVSNLRECNKSESGQTLNTRAGNSSDGQWGRPGSLVSVVTRQLSGNRSSRFLAGTALCSVRGPLVLISSGIADTRSHGEQQVTGNCGDWRLEERSKYHMTQQTDPVRSFRIV